MTEEERKSLRHALIAATNAFNRALQDRGFHASVCDIDGKRAIYANGRPPEDNWPLGELTLRWNIKKG